VKKVRVKRHTVEQPLDASYRYIPLTQGRNAIVDKDDFEFISQFNWLANKPPRSKTFYATRKGGILMHRVITNCPKNLQVDHKNCDGLDNRKENLRYATQSQNLQNKPKKQRASTPFYGVHKISYSTRAGIKILYMAQANVGGKQKYLGCRKTPEEAAQLHDTYVNGFARANFH
jgi:hypothetical protein